MLMLLLALLQQTTYNLTVVGGSGSGVYRCDATATITAPRSKGTDMFAQWTAHPMGAATIDAVHHRKAIVKNPDCHDLTIEAMFAPKPKRTK